MGFVISHRLYLRVSFLQQYVRFIEYVETEIRYAHKILESIINNYENDSDFINFIHMVKQNLTYDRNFSKAWEKAVYKIPSSFGLTMQDKKTICEFGATLGATDVMGQISICKLNKSLIRSILEVAKEEKNKKSKLYFMLSSSFGICITIILL